MMADRSYVFLNRAFFHLSSASSNILCHLINIKKKFCKDLIVNYSTEVYYDFNGYKIK